jgi:hypothetical protein
MRLMACAAFVLHGTVLRKCFSLKRNARMASQASLLLRLQPLPVVLGGEFVTSSAVKSFHPANVRTRLGVTINTFLGRGLDRV